MVGHRTVNAAVAGSSPAIRAISLSLRLNVYVFAPRLAVIITPLMCEAVAKPGRDGVPSPSVAKMTTLPAGASAFFTHAF